MTVETATFINTLDATLPTSTDPKSEGDNHLRVIKGAIKATFPNVTGEVTVSHTALNNVVVTQAPGDNSTKTATTAFVKQEIDAAFDSFDDRYLGAKATAPTVDNDGNALIVGAKYFNSTENKMYVRNASNSWQLDTADSNSVNYLAAGSGAVSTTVQSKLRESVSVKDFGAVGNGVADDTAAIQAAINSGAGCVFLPKGIYNTSSPIVLESSSFKLYGEGPYSIIQTSSDIDLFRLKIDSYISSVEVTGLRLRYVGAGSQAAGSGIRLWDSTGTGTGGAGIINIHHITFTGLYHCIAVDNPSKVDFGGIVQIGNYYNLHFTDLYCPDGPKTQAFGILFKGAPGNHHTISGCFLSNDTANIRMGDGGTDTGVGDQLIYGNHLLNAQYGVDLIGPTGVGRYNQNVNIICNHFDGTLTNTVRMSNMSNFRSWLNNSTASVGVSLTTCSNYALDDRNSFSLPNLALRGDLNTTSGVLVDSNGTRVGQVAAFRRNANDSSLRVSGGNLDGAGAYFELFGGTHATNANWATLNGNEVLLRSQNGSRAFFRGSDSGQTASVGNGAWNGTRLALGTYQLWVDSTGDLRIKNGAPTSDTDGTVVGTQT